MYKEDKIMNYHNIKHDDMNNGDGIRVTLFVSGCEHHCHNCQNPQTWDYNSGIEFDENAFNELCIEMDKDYISGITFSGGDPLAPQNVEKVKDIVVNLKKLFPSKTVWMYTGYKYEQLLFEGKHDVIQILKHIDVLVDGRYVEDKRDVSLKWRGSSNQRVLDMQKSLIKGKEVLYCE